MNKTYFLQGIWLTRVGGEIIRFPDGKRQPFAHAIFVGAKVTDSG